MGRGQAGLGPQQLLASLWGTFFRTEERTHAQLAPQPLCLRPWISGKWGRFFNPCPAHINAHFKPSCAGTHPQQVLAATQLSEVAAWPPGPPRPHAAPDPAAPPEAGAGAQMGAQKGGRAGLFLAKAGAEVTQVQLRAGVGWTTDIPEGSSQKEVENPGSGTPSSCSDKKQEGGLIKAGTAAHALGCLGRMLPEAHCVIA